MTKFKILSFALCLIVCLYITAIICLAYFISTTSFNPNIPQAQTVYLCTAASYTLLFGTGLFFLQRSCSMFVKRTYFNSKSGRYLKISGYIFMASALFGFALAFTKLEWAPKKDIFSDFTSELGYNLTLLFVGFGLTAVADIIKKGENIKRENDLTI